MKNDKRKSPRKNRPKKRAVSGKLARKTPAEQWRETAFLPALADGPRDPKQPLWAPEGTDLSCVPVEVRQAADEIIKPIYEQFVVGAGDGLEKSLGLTLTHLLWLEVLDQFDLKREYTQVNSVLGVPKDREQLIAQHLRLIDSKVRVGYFLVRLRELHKRLAAQPPVLLPNPDPNSPIPPPQSLIPQLQNPPNQAPDRAKIETR